MGEIFWKEKILILKVDFWEGMMEIGIERGSEKENGKRREKRNGKGRGIEREREKEIGNEIEEERGKEELSVIWMIINVKVLNVMMRGIMNMILREGLVVGEENIE